MGQLIYIGLDELPKLDKTANRAFLSREYLQQGKILKLQAMHIIDGNGVAWADVPSQGVEIPVYEVSKNEEDPPWLCIINTAVFVWRNAYNEGFNQVWLLHKYVSDEHPAIFGALRGIVDLTQEDEGTT